MHPAEKMARRFVQGDNQLSQPETREMVLALLQIIKYQDREIDDAYDTLVKEGISSLKGPGRLKRLRHRVRHELKRWGPICR
jgi:hypothetical protein